MLDIEMGRHADAKQRLNLFLDHQVLQWGIA